ncbi:ent-kaurene oxidase [Xylariaceae sp. FL0016]|nr:ent-kaurene oxidase [Xylariaceae sp. FL0016]
MTPFVTLVLACSVPLFVLVVRHVAHHLRGRRFPLLAKDLNDAERRQWYLTAAFEVYERGYKRMRNTFHRVTTLDGDHIVIPNAYLDELGKRPDDEVDVLTAFSKILENDYIALFPEKRKTDIVNGIVKKDLTRALPRLNSRLSAEVEVTVRQELPMSLDWAPVNIMSSLLRIVAIVSGSVFVGPELCRREEYLRSAIDYAVDIVQASAELKRRPGWMRPLFARILPEFSRLTQHRKNMQKFLRPVVEERRELLRKGEPLPDDTLSWMLQATEKSGIVDIADLTNMQLLLTMAAIHTTTLSATILLYDLVVRPEIVQELRSEVTKVLEAHDGIMTPRALFDMKLMDSVMRESQRLSPPFFDGFRRYTLKDVALRDGTHVIPAGYIIEAANGPILRDDDLYPDAEKFDPYRFYRLRAFDSPDPIGFRNREQYQFVSVTKENMSFGFGRHACPGRFFAANEIKLILAQLLLNYDMKLPAGSLEGYKAFYTA